MKKHIFCSRCWKILFRNIIPNSAIHGRCHNCRRFTEAYALPQGMDHLCPLGHRMTKLDRTLRTMAAGG